MNSRGSAPMLSSLRRSFSFPPLSLLPSPLPPSLCEFLFPRTLQSSQELLHMQMRKRSRCVRHQPHRDPVGRSGDQVSRHSVHFSGVGKGTVFNAHNLRPATCILDNARAVGAEIATHMLLLLLLLFLLQW